MYLQIASQVRYYAAMDNLSHSVVGLAAGELIHRSLTPESDSVQHSMRRRMLLAAGALACNFPDLDLVLSPLIANPLGYLLHHRGHTHTLLLLIPQALLLMALIWALWPAARALLRSSRHARFGLAATVAAGLLLHLGMDALNSYGVHPFYPFDVRWFYADLVFILEPVFWLAFGVPLAMMLRRAPLRWLALAGLAALPLFFYTRNYLAPATVAALLAMLAVLAWLQRRASDKGRCALLCGVALSASFIGIQALAMQQARSMVAAELARRDPASELVDAAMTAFPGNPLCWNFATVERNERAGSYRLRRGTLRLAGDHCPIALLARTKQSAAPLSISWEHEASLAQLRALRAANCHADAWLRFGRMPLFDGLDVNDARYGTATMHSFASMTLTGKDGPCPSSVPPWEYPRRDLLGP